MSDYLNKKTKDRRNTFTYLVAYMLTFTAGLYIGQLNDEAEELCLKHWQVITSKTTSKGSVYCKVSATPEVWQVIKDSQIQAYRRSN